MDNLSHLVVIKIVLMFVKSENKTKMKPKMAILETKTDLFDPSPPGLITGSKKKIPAK